MQSESGRLLDTLTRALQSSGVDLSQANISVQIDLGKNATVAAAADTSAKVSIRDESLHKKLLPLNTVCLKLCGTVKPWFRLSYILI